jgi:hypothetical protein
MIFLFSSFLIIMSLLKINLDLMPLQPDICANWKCRIFGLKSISCKKGISCTIMAGTRGQQREKGGDTDGQLNSRFRNGTAPIRLSKNGKRLGQDCCHCLHQICGGEFLLAIYWRIESQKPDDRGQKVHHQLVNGRGHFFCDRKTEIQPTPVYINIDILFSLSTKSSVMTKLGKMPKVTCDLN